MAVTFFAASAAGLAANATTTTLPLIAPANLATDDILIAVVLEKAVQVITLPNTEVDGISAWTKFVEVDNGANQRTTIAWARVTNGTNASSNTVNATKPTDDNILFCGAIYAFRGCIASGSPLDPATPSQSLNTPAADAVTYATFDPTFASHIVAVGTYNDDITTAGTISGTNPTLDNRSDLETNTGTDGSIFVYSGDSSDGAATGARSHSTTSAIDAISTGIIFGLIPQLPDVTPTPLAVAVTVTAPTLTPGAVTMNATPLAIPVVVPAPALTATLTLATAALAIPIMLPDPTVTNAGSTPATLTITLKQGAATIKAWAAEEPGLAIGDIVLALTEAELATITYPATDLTIEIAGDVGTDADVRVYEIALTAPGSAVITLLPSPLTIPIATPAPTVTAGAVTLTPSPVTIPLVVTTPTLSATITASPAPLAIPVMVTAPTVSAGAVTLSPDALAVPVVITTPSATIGQGIFPDALAIPIVVTTPSLVPGAATVSPSPLAIPVIVTAPTLAASYTASPAPLTIPIVVTAPSLSGTVTLSTSPLDVPIVIPVPTAATGTALAPTPLTIPVVIPAPVVTSVYLVTTTALVVPIVIPAPALTAGTATVTPAPVAVPVVVPAPVVTLFLTIVVCDHTDIGCTLNEMWQFFCWPPSRFLTSPAVPPLASGFVDVPEPEPVASGFIAAPASGGTLANMVEPLPQPAGSGYIAP